MTKRQPDPSGLPWGKISFAVLGLILWTLSLAGLAETFIEWRDYFSEGVLKNYNLVKIRITNFLSLHTIFFDYVVGGSYLASATNVARSIAKSVNKENLKTGKIIWWKYVIAIITWPIVLINVMLLFISTLLGHAKNDDDKQFIYFVTICLLITIIPFIGLVMFASDLIVSW